MTGTLTLSGNPTAAMHAATKQYTDNFALREYVRFTASGTFNPASYPSKNNLYFVLAVGGGQGGSASSNGTAGYVSTGFVVVASSVAVTVGAGGSGGNQTGSTGGTSGISVLRADGGGVSQILGNGIGPYGGYGEGGKPGPGGGYAGTAGTAGIVIVYGFPV